MTEEKSLRFEEVLKALRTGRAMRASRAGWNGKNMFVFLHKGENIHADKRSAYILSVDIGELIYSYPYLSIRTSQNTIGPWRPTQIDMFAADWCIEI